ncbi:vegetative cell wall protein gp1-like [Miscanthus floridulus]|uniref:vegetative cell wall protein gp1-like n=1 Tax=Miscanthus floridulus TaxID=154761 RepID=UPI003459627C
MASSSSNPSSTSSSSTTSTPSAARVLSDSERRMSPRLPNPAAAPAASAALGVVPSANASASATAPGVATGAIPPPLPASHLAPSPPRPRPMSHQTPSPPPPRPASPAPSNDLRHTPPPPGAAPKHVSRKPSQERGWQTAADPTSMFAPSRLSTEGSSPSTSAWSKPLPYVGITLVPNASGSAPAVATSADTVLEPDASTSSRPA